MKHLIVLFLFSIAICQIKAQSVNGSWYGVGHIQMEGNTENYLSELILKVDGTNLKGEFNYYFRDSLFKNKIKCSFNKKTRILIIHKFPVIYFRSHSTKKAVMCDVNGTFELRVAKTESVLNGSLTPASELNFLMPIINYRMVKDPDLASNKKSKSKVVNPVNLEESATNSSTSQTKFDSTKKKDLIKNATPEQSLFSEKKIIPVAVITEKAFNNRKKDYTKTIDVENSTIQLEVYDNGTIDYDSVSLLLNGKLILPKTMLTHHSVKLTIQLDESLEYNELGMFAENLGLIPPNTAALIIRDGKKKYEVILNSDFNKNAIIQLKTNKENKKD
jgi:archaellum component FlaF (FlaF/FlaG flagellin family)